MSKEPLFKLTIYLRQSIEENTYLEINKVSLNTLEKLLFSNNDPYFIFQDTSNVSINGFSIPMTNILGIFYKEI